MSDGPGSTKKPKSRLIGKKTDSEPDMVLGNLSHQVTTVDMNTGGSSTDLEMSPIRTHARGDSDAKINISQRAQELTTVYSNGDVISPTEGRVHSPSSQSSPSVMGRGRSVDKMETQIHYLNQHTQIDAMFEDKEESEEQLPENRKISDLTQRQNLDIVRLLLFVVCLCVFVLLGVVQRGSSTSDAYFQTSVPSRILLQTPFPDTTGGDILFADINSISNIHVFMSTVVLPFVYRDKTFLYGEDFSFEMFNTTLSETSGPQMYVLGGIRLRQLRYSYVPCEDDIKEHGFELCVDRTASKNNLTIWVQGKLETIEYKSQKDLDEQIYFIGKTKNFPGDGHVWDLPVPAKTSGEVVPTYESAQAQLSDLFDHGFITELTRGLFVDFNMFNPNTGLHTLCRLLFEIHPAGSIIPYHSFNTWNFLLYWQGNTNTTVVLVFFIFLITLLVFDHINGLYIFCRDSNYPAWLTYCGVAPPEDTSFSYRPNPEESLDRANRAKYIYITGVSRQAIENECDEIQDWIYEHLEEMFSNSQGESGLEAFEVLEITFMNEWRCCGVEIGGLFTRYITCTDYCHNGLRVRVSATIYDNPLYKKQLEKKIQQKGGPLWNSAKIRGADEGEGACCRRICGAGGQAFYRYSFWNKLDLFVIVSLTVQCILHIYFIFTLGGDDAEDRLLSQDKYVSFRVLHSNLVVENNMFVMNGFLIPLKILQYCTMLTDDFRWFHEFMLIAQQKICTFFALLFVFLLAFSVSGWLAFSADLYDFRHIIASVLACIRYIFVGPDYLQLELSSNLSGVIYYIFWYILMSLILIPLLIAVFVNLALKVEEWVKSGNQSRKTLDVRSEDHLRIIFTRPRPLKKAKEWFEEAFPESDVETIIKSVVENKNVKFQVDLDCALEILNKIRQEVGQFQGIRRENTSKADNRHQEVLEALTQLQQMVSNMSFSQNKTKRE